MYDFIRAFDTGLPKKLSNCKGYDLEVLFNHLLISYVN
jgi:hypothetical protein